MAKKTATKDDKCFFCKQVTAFVLRRGNLRIDYKPSSFTSGVVSFTRETSDPSDWMDEIPEEQYLKLKKQVLATLDGIIESLAKDEYPQIDVEDDNDEE